MPNEIFTIPKWTRLHHNAIAKEIREGFPIDTSFNRRVAPIERATLASLALSFAKRFQADNPNFKPLIFLDACSPNTDLYPLSELWED